jgi:aldose 1-epimerase
VTGGRVHLATGAARLEVDPADGGRWTSLRVDGTELLAAVDIAGGHPPTLSGCFAMAPFAGRLSDARLPWAGTVHELPPHAAPHAIHGTAVDAVWSVVEASGTQLVLEHELGEPWPFAGSVRAELSLTEDALATVLTVQALDEMPAVIGWHPWLRRRLDRGGEAVLHVDPVQQYEKGPDALPTGRLVAPTPGPHDDCFLGLAQPPRVVWPGALELVVDSPTDHWVVMTEHPDALAVEPQTGPPDAIRLGQPAVVPAGGTLALTATFRWRVLTGTGGG